MSLKGRQTKGYVGVNTGQREADDLYRTHGSVIDGLLRVMPMTGRVWEPSCGRGDLAEALRRKKLRVVATDLVDRGYGRGNVNFLTCRPRACDHIVTNPPFKLLEEFLLRALSVVPTGGKIAFVTRLAWLEGEGRYKRVFSLTPPSSVYVMVKRPLIAPGPDAPFRSGLIAFCWCVWTVGDRSKITSLGWV